MPSFSGLTISAIIPVHNGGNKFRRCLSSLSALAPAPREIIVVTDGDMDASRHATDEFGFPVLSLPTSGGPARARNLGAAKAQGDILFFIDADVTIPRDAVDQVTTAFQNDPSLTAVFGSYDDEPLETNFLSQYKNLFHHFVHQTSKEDASTFWGACGAIRRKVFLEVGGFDEVYRHPSIEDIELGYRLKKAGHAIRILKGLKVKHMKRWDVLSLLKADFFYRALPWTGLILREGRFIDDLNLKISNRLSVISVYILFLTLLGALFLPWLFAPMVFLMMALLALNRGLYRFFKNKRGLGFAIKTIPWHWFYFFYSGLAFSIGLINYHIKRLKLLSH